MIGKLDEALGFQEAAIRIREQRQQVLASNIANADTPDYKARDFDFKAALELALSGSPEGKLARTDEMHMKEKKGAAASKDQEMVAGVPLLYRTIQQGSVDGNTVDMDVERNQFMDNALHYEASVTMINQQIKNLLAVIQG